MKQPLIEHTEDAYKGLSPEQRKALFELELQVMKFSKATIDAFAQRMIAKVKEPRGANWVSSAEAATWNKDI